MKHTADGTLRACIDGELNSADLAAVEAHLQSCDRCRRRAEEMTAGARAIDELLAARVGGAVPDIDRAWLRFTNRRETAPAPARLWLRPPAWAALAAAAMLVLLATSAPTRAVARKLLGIFRVKNVVAVPMEHDFLAGGKGQLIGDLLSASVTVTKDEKPQPARNPDEAAGLAGFAVRLPALRTDAPRTLRVEGAHEFHLTVDRQRVESFLDLVHRRDLHLPPEFAGAQVTVETPRGVLAAYGECPDSARAVAEPSRLLSCIDLLQVPSSTVTTIPELDLAQLAIIGLQVSGMTQSQAESFSRTIDWTSTLAIALPRESASFENVNVRGDKGILVIGRQYANWPTRWALIWVRDERVYRLGGFGDPAMALRVAESLQ